jgi:RNA polymerase sigma-70 factor (ECF subfamily)
MPDPRPDSEETRRLLDAAAAGDPAAPGLLLARHRDGLRVFVEVHLDPAVRGRLDPSDVVQEAMTDLARGLAAYLAARPVPFRLWACKAALDRARNARRDHRAARRDVAREAPAAGPDQSSVMLARTVVHSGPSPSEAAVRRELVDRVAAAVEALADADREVLLMRHVDDLAYDEIGVLLGIEPAAARKRYGRALVRLERVLGDDGLRGA